MGTKTLSNSLANEQELAIQTQVMAIREQLMEYFKGTCVQRLADGAKIEIATVYPAHTRFTYERRELENRQPARVYLDQVPILGLIKAPDSVTFYEGTLGRSPQLREIKLQI